MWACECVEGVPTMTTRSVTRTESRRPTPGRRWVRRSVVLVAAVGALAGGWVWGVPHWQARGHWNAAREAVEGRDFAAAEQHLKKLIDLRPDDSDARLELARVYRRGHRPDPAAAELTEAERCGAPRAAVELERVLQRTQSGHVAALSGFPASAVGSEEDRLIREALAAGHLQVHFLDRAFRVTEKWIEDRPGDWLAHLWHGRVLERGLQFELAADAYKRALELRPGQPEAERGRGEVLLRHGRYDEARPHFEAVLRADSGDAAARLGLARCYRALGSPTEAREVLQPLLEAADPAPAVCLLAGELDLDGDRPGDALPWLRRAATAVPHDRDVNQTLATTLRQLDRPDEARVYEARAEAALRDYKEMEVITKAVTQAPGDAQLRYEAGVILARLGQDAGAARWLLSALTLNPRHEPSRKALADLTDRLGDSQLSAYCRRVLVPASP